MKTSALDFPYPARRVYTACMAALRECGAFRSIDGDERSFRITASKGLPIFEENSQLGINQPEIKLTKPEIRLR